MRSQCLCSAEVLWIFWITQLHWVPDPELQYKCPLGDIAAMKGFSTVSQKCTRHDVSFVVIYRNSNYTIMSRIPKPAKILSRETVFPSTQAHWSPVTLCKSFIPTTFHTAHTFAVSNYTLLRTEASVPHRGIWACFSDQLVSAAASATAWAPRLRFGLVPGKKNSK